MTEGDQRHVWVYDILAGTSTQLTFEGTNRNPAWSPDGKRVSFTTDRTGAWELFVIPADRSGSAELLSTTELKAPFEIRHTWTRDGGWIVFDMDTDSTGRNIVAFPMDGDRTVQPIVARPGRQLAQTVSPNGQWLAYVSKRRR